MAVQDEHRQQWRERYGCEGESAFDDQQLLELLLFYAISRRDTDELAHQLLSRFGSLKAVLRASIDELSTVPGLGGSAATLVRLAYDISCRAQQLPPSREETKFPKQAGKYFFQLLHEQRVEKLYAAFLDAQERLISCRCLSEGTVTSTSIEIRPIVAYALYLDASGVILAHNHPGGQPLPSQADLSSTRGVERALAPLNIALKDHIIVSDNEYTSLADTGGWDRSREVKK